eukprot:scaffold10188_cov280-Chaetoceros_neogracile.AAC.14
MKCSSSIISIAMAFLLLALCLPTTRALPSSDEPSVLPSAAKLQVVVAKVRSPSVISIIAPANISFIH